LTIQNLFDVKWKETQFDTESRLKDEPEPISQIHFTPGTPFFCTGKLYGIFLNNRYNRDIKERAIVSDRSFPKII
jgi:hypothetical protein